MSAEAVGENATSIPAAPTVSSEQRHLAANAARQAVVTGLLNSSEYIPAEDLTGKDASARLIQPARSLGEPWDRLSVCAEIQNYRSSLIDDERRVDIDLSIIVKNETFGIIVNGAAVRCCVSAAASLHSRDDLFREAVSLSVREVVRTLVEFPRPDGIICSGVGNGYSNLQILANRGRLDGIFLGQSILVHRGQEVIGFARAIGVFPTDMELELTLAKSGVYARPLDQVIGVFPISRIRPSYIAEFLP